ncbi:MAG TPA: NAD(P)/FAD-dependent oxidoreductase [Thermoplasmata archaeon]
MRADIAVVGAGPSGSTAARLLARNHDVVLVEEHERPGEPLQCAGLVSPRGIPEFARESVLSKVRGARIHSPSGFVIDLEASRTRACVIDRSRFDKLLFDRAVDEGVSAMLGSSVRNVIEDSSNVTCELRSNGNISQLQASALIGADGYRSICRRKAKQRPPRHMIKGIQVDLKGLDFDPEFVELYVGRSVAPGFFAWIIPAGDLTRVGVCTWHAKDLPATYLRKFLSRPELSRGKRVSITSGKIPIGAGRTAQRGRIALVGDAACHAKPLSGGGVYTGIRGAELCAQVMDKFVADGGTAGLEEYDQLWKEAFGKELSRAFRLRRIFVGLSDKKIDKALKILAQPEVIALLQDKGDIDYPASLTSTVLKLAPKLAQFSPEIIESFL